MGPSRAIETRRINISIAEIPRSVLAIRGYDKIPIDYAIGLDEQMTTFSSLRLQTGYELDELATDLGATLGDVAKWETGEVGAPLSVLRTLETISRLANDGDALDMSPSLKADATGQLYEGDCLEILPQLDKNSVDLILCDLPYGTTQNRWDSVIDLDRLWAEYRRVIKPGGVIVLTAQGVFTAKLILSNETWFKYKIVWEKSKSTNFLNAKKQPLRKHEDICVFYDRAPIYNPQMQAGLPYDKGIRKSQLSGSYGDFLPAHVRSDGDRYPSDVIYFKTAESEQERQVWHPTQKPVELGRYLIRTYSNEGGTVLDNAFGSGSFIVAAAMEKRNFIGIEKNQEVHLFKNEKIDYVDVAAKRLSRLDVVPHIVRRQ